MKKKVKKLLRRLAIDNVTELYTKLLENHSDDELHAMSEEQIIELIKLIYPKRKKKIKKEAKLIYI